MKQHSDIDSLLTPLNNQLEALGDLVHKRGNTIASLQRDKKKLMKALEDFVDAAENGWVDSVYVTKEFNKLLKEMK